jgi:uroporphyrinogen decarboxylase
MTCWMSCITNDGIARVIKKHIIPQYRRIVELIHGADRPFLWHSCGNIFSIMDQVIAIGINAKHSNEDVIAQFEKWYLAFIYP